MRSEVMIDNKNLQANSNFLCKKKSKQTTTNKSSELYVKLFTGKICYDVTTKSNSIVHIK